jgi:hypothetical protein
VTENDFNHIGADYGHYELTNVVASTDTRRRTLQSLYRPNKSCLNDADEVGASPESPADTDSNNGNNNLHDSDDEILWI